MQEELKNLAKALQESNLNHNVIFERAYKEESKKANYLTPSSFTACLCKMNSNLQHKGSRTALIVTEYQESIDNPLNPSTKIVMCNYKKLCNELDIIIQHKPRMNLFFQKLLELMRKGKNSLFSNLTNLDYNGSANTGKIDMEKFSQLFYNSTNTMITPEEAETLKSIYDSEGKKIIDHVALKNDFINYCNNANVKYDDLIAIKPYSQKEKAYLGRPVFVNFDYFMNKNQITDPRDFFRDYGMNEEACTVTRFSFYDAIHDFYPAISTQIYNMLEDEMQTDRKEAISVTRFIQRYEEIRKDIDRTSEYQFYGSRFS
jgi:Ca2+-binding EF-hand superfamily protein